MAITRASDIRIQHEGVEWGNWCGILTEMFVVMKSPREGVEGVYDGLVIYEGDRSTAKEKAYGIGPSREVQMAIAVFQIDRELGMQPAKTEPGQPPRLTNKRWVVNRQGRFMALPKDFDLEHFDTMMKVGMP